MRRDTAGTDLCFLYFPNLLTGGYYPHVHLEQLSRTLRSVFTAASVQVRDGTIPQLAFALPPRHYPDIPRDPLEAW